MHFHHNTGNANAYFCFIFSLNLEDLFFDPHLTYFNYGVENFVFPDFGIFGTMKPFPDLCQDLRSQEKFSPFELENSEGLADTLSIKAERYIFTYLFIFTVVAIGYSIIQDANKCIWEIQRPLGNSFRRFMERGI